MRIKHETKHRRKDCSKIKDHISSSKKIDHRNFWICLSKRTDTEMKKNKSLKKKDDKKNELKQKEDTQKRRWRKTDKETWDTEKRERETVR